MGRRNKHLHSKREPKREPGICVTCERPIEWLCDKRGNKHAVDVGQTRNHWCPGGSRALPYPNLGVTELASAMALGSLLHKSRTHNHEQQ